MLTLYQNSCNLILDIILPFTFQIFLGDFLCYLENNEVCNGLFPSCLCPNKLQTWGYFHWSITKKNKTKKKKKKKSFLTKPLIIDLLGCKYTAELMYLSCAWLPDNTPYSVISMEVFKHNCNIVWFICMPSVGDISVILSFKVPKHQPPKSCFWRFIVRG